MKIYKKKIKIFFSHITFFFLIVSNYLTQKKKKKTLKPKCGDLTTQPPHFPATHFYIGLFLSFFFALKI